MIQKIITYPNPILRKKAKPVTVFDDHLLEIIESLNETMFDARSTVLMSRKPCDGADGGRRPQEPVCVARRYPAHSRR